MPRLGHKKSRNGCRQCKARHVKCDESKPCSNCSRHGVLCSLVDPNAPPPASSANSSSSAPKRVTKTLTERPRKASTQSTTASTASLPIEYVLNPSPAPTGGASDDSSPHSQPDPFPYLTRFVNKSDAIQPNYWVRDLELMHHWTTEAHYTISQREETRHMWRIVAPKQAVTHTFLMHQMLAFAALHMAYLQSDQRVAYYSLGIHHQDLAIREMRKILQNLSADNAGAVFATSAVVTLSVFASTGLEALNYPPSNPQAPIESLLDIFSLMQGMGGVLASAQVHVVESSFRTILQRPEYEIPPQPVFAEILAQLPYVTSIFENNEDLEDDMRREYLNFVSSFGEVLRHSGLPCTDQRELRFLFHWPVILGSNFFYWLRQRHWGALVILMHYAVVLCAAGDKYWFMKGWGSRVMTATSDALDPSWQYAIQWPLQFMQTQQVPTPEHFQEQVPTGV